MEHNSNKGEAGKNDVIEQKIPWSDRVSEFDAVQNHKRAAKFLTTKFLFIYFLGEGSHSAPHQKKRGNAGFKFLLAFPFWPLQPFVFCLRPYFDIRYQLDKIWVQLQNSKLPKPIHVTKLTRFLLHSGTKNKFNWLINCHKNENVD